jgi:hypothetical protein
MGNKLLETPFRVFYEFKPYFINNIRHRWSLCYCVDLQKWFKTLYAGDGPRGHDRIKQSDMAINEIFNSNQLETIRVYDKEGLAKSVPYLILK